ncbi:MAG: hypothetical protein Q8N83_09980 [Ignavibacteria bacterium]|nr:hypothetical protein [Ignavibacteria bacterium]
MKTSNLFKIIWWSFIFIVTSIIAYDRYSKLSTNPTSVDVIIIIFWITILLLPLISEINIFGFSLKKEINEIKNDIVKEVGFILKSEISNVSNVNPQFYFNLPTEKEIPQLIEQFKALSEKVQPVADVKTKNILAKTSKLAVPEEKENLFKIRYAIEGNLVRLWEKYLSAERTKKMTPILGIIRDLNEHEVITPDVTNLLSNLFGIINYSLHGGKIKEDQQIFVFEEGKRIITLLESIK